MSGIDVSKFVLTRSPVETEDVTLAEDTGSDVGGHCKERNIRIIGYTHSTNKA